MRSGWLWLCLAAVAVGAELSPADSLLSAAHRGDAPAVEELLRAGAPSNARNPYGATAITEAAANGHVAVLAALLRAGADANQTASGGETALMLASLSGSVEGVRLLLEHGAAVNARDGWKQQTALMWAAGANRAEVAKLLIAKGAELDAHSTIWPAEVEHPANGNLVSKQPKGGLTPLLYAAREGSLDAAKVLIAAGADLNLAEPDGVTPVVMALINAHYDLAGALLEAGANPNVQDRYGRSPLYTAIDMYTMEPSGTRPAPRTEDRLNGFDIAKLALAKGADPNVRLRESVPGRSVSDNPDPILRGGTTPFIRAAKTGDVEGMKLLMAHGADPYLTTNEGINALMAASGQGWRFGDSLIPESAAMEAVRLCLTLKYDINAANRKGETALHGAAMRGGDAIAKLLVANGASLYMRDLQGHTPYNIAAGDGSRGLPGYKGTAAVFEQLMASAATEVKQIKRGLYVIEAPLNGAEGPNLSFLVTTEGVVLVDDRWDQNFQQVSERIRSVTDQPIRYVIKTHHHSEHTGAYKKQFPAVVTIAHENARKHMLEARMTGPPDMVFSDEYSLWLGGKEIRLLHPGNAHTDGDIAIFFPAERTVYAGDLMAATDSVTNPTMDYANGGSLKQWPAALDRVLALDFDTVVPGTGHSVTGKDTLQKHRAKVEQVRQRAAALVQAKTSKEDLTKVLIDEFSFKPVNLRSVDGMLIEMTN
ncbi:MAG: ankyrin repeat domain-containing protein [Acidobacteriota bacterium]